jgi:hypothetical protein
MIESLLQGSPLLTPAQQDSAQAVDSLRGFVPESPLPGGVADVVRYLFTLPQWFQIVGFIAGMIVAAWIAWRLWQHRQPIVHWIATRSTKLKVAMGVVVALAVLSVAAFGMVSWNYMQHDNDFCTACHVMSGAFTRFQESEHSDLSCHDCHKQSIFASTRQLYLWVTERPVEIGMHSPVPDSICEKCHVTGQPEVWQRILQTAGHRTHFESDSSALRNIMCVTCHGQEVHRFVPVNQTCGQSGCHENLKITLDSMANQTSLHCAACHRFVEEVPVLATADSARGSTVPTLRECSDCHEMQQALGDFDPATEPHGAACGTCHNPHTQASAADAAKTCTNAGCHDNWRTRPFHVGPAHINVGQQCILCHEPHASRVDPSDCVGCHTKVLQKPNVPRAVRERLQRALPFDTTRAMGPNALAPAVSPPATGQVASVEPIFWGIGWSIAAQPPWVLAMLQPPAPQDSFPHDRHTSLTCLNCHTAISGHGGLTFQAPRGCQICHHRDAPTADCESCHAPDAVNQPMTAHIAVTIEDTLTRRHDVTWTHSIHHTPACVDCHTTRVTLVPPAEVAQCVDCHDNHHTADRSCVTCHASESIVAAHAPPKDAHVGCDACHDRATVERLMPDRSFCLTCHQPQATQHHEDTGRECTVCHFLVSPADFRSRLVSGGTR